MSFCLCGSGQQTLGVLGCYDAFESVKKHIRVNTFDSQGNRNGILLTDLVEGKLTDAYILGKLTEDDASKRWYITPNTYENVAPSTTDPTYEDMSSGTSYLVDDGAMMFEGYLPKTSGVIAERMKASSCTSFGNYEVDTAGSLKGEMSADGSVLYPITVSQGSFNAVVEQPIEGSSVQKIKVTFQYAKTVKEGQLRIINAENIDVNLLDVNGSLLGTLEETGVATTTTVSVLFDIDSFGQFGVVIPLEGQEDTANWEIIDSGLNVLTPSSVVGFETGQYDLTVPSMDSGTATIEFKGVPLSALDQSYDSNVLSFEVV